MRDVPTERAAAGSGRGAIVNAMTVDVEDYFQVSAFDKSVGRQTWETRESRVERNTLRLLEHFDTHGVRATFFVLGWVADRYPSLLRRIAAAGHELGSHGYDHRLVYELSPREFREDVRQAKASIESAAGVPVLGYRAPSYSITERSKWALDILVEEGYAYDASIFPIYHDRYGIPTAPRHPHMIHREAGAIWELPGSTVRIGGVNVPVAGGGYFRILPYRWTRWGIGRLNRQERCPAVFYLHPWEIDPGQPRLWAPPLGRWRHYRNLHKTESRLVRLCREFRFSTVEDVLAFGLTAATLSPAGARGPVLASRISRTFRFNSDRAEAVRDV